MVNAIEIINLSKIFGNTKVLQHVNFEIKNNEFFTLLGPSGCGKTTLLRMIAGFEDTSEGSIKLFGNDIQDTPVHKRNINTVFQNYALFPHMTIRKNVAFPLEMLKWNEQDIKQRVDDMLQAVHMQDFANRYPSQLSGGQKQRVALARALSPKPKVLLLDEPLSALDLKLRQNMRLELRNIQKEVGITFIFVTHDQEEALEMSDRICILANKQVQQIGTPQSIYESPVNKFVADFIGETNFLNATLQSVTENQASVMTDIGTFTAPAANICKNDNVCVSLRPEKISINSKEKDIHITATVIDTYYMGGYSHYKVKISKGTELYVSKRNENINDISYPIGAEVDIGFNVDSARVLKDA